ncbi:hypothetical protein CALCODRAFT_140399 [Calocera cornea HHB12733]|uniref:Uncharacterized protein n=1 Tax=Calocera cornea HHB12733 TaxID=1353952 RepID=A0A165K4N0_9BASI|nr:hypothetical protein CALCODRAFT_140399 [Calocera cornea HHB12733]
MTLTAREFAKSSSCPRPPAHSVTLLLTSRSISSLDRARSPLDHWQFISLRNTFRHRPIPGRSSSPCLSSPHLSSCTLARSSSRCPPLCPHPSSSAPRRPNPSLLPTVTPQIIPPANPDARRRPHQ